MNQGIIFNSKKQIHKEKLRNEFTERYIAHTIQMHWVKKRPAEILDQERAIRATEGEKLEVRRVISKKM